MSSPTDAPPEPDDGIAEPARAHVAHDDADPHTTAPRTGDATRAEVLDPAGAPGDGGLAAASAAPTTPPQGRLAGSARWLARTARRISPEGWISIAVVSIATGFVLAQLQPELLVRNTTPAGGDMGAHVWGPAYLRDELLAEGRLTGWTRDWYAGFPAYQFYMVVPALLILLLDVVLPYGIAFKLVTVAGVLSLPAAAWAFGRLAGTRFPAPPIMAVGAVVFLFDRSYTIYGGNLASTLAGEFSFSISLSVALVYLGVVAKGLQTGRHRALAATLLGLTALCHLIPAIFALAGTAVFVLLRADRASTWRWVLPVVPIGSAIAAFWVLPFWWQRAYVNDMGWEKLTPEPGLPLVDWGGVLGDGSGGQLAELGTYLVPADLRWLVVLAIVGVVMSILRRQQAGIALAILSLVWMQAFVWIPQGRLWNARLLPFLYLGYALLAAIGVSEVGRSVAAWLARAVGAEEGVRPAELAARWVRGATAVVALLVVLVVVGLPLGVLPLGDRGSDGVYRWGPVETADRSFLPDWARWNYTGYEGKDSYREYHDVVQTMAAVGEERGCGRAMWEYESELDRYGTPMALMLLPHWTDGCIGSMEGLYFESSATTPFHFLNQSELSDAPSSAMRDIPYQGFDLELGVQHLQMLGVRYYMATSERAIAEADEQPDLTPIASSGPWQVYEVAGSDLVVPLENEPAVWADVEPEGRAWLDPAAEWYVDPEQWDTFRAADGPEEWQRIGEGEAAEVVPVDAVEVTEVVETNDSISFRVSEPGTPVLVRTSFFPNWHATGAEGPYRVAPNLMVVVPTEEQVSLDYGYEPVDWIAWLITLAGVVGVVALWRLDRRRPTPDLASSTAPEGPDLTPDGDDGRGGGAGPPERS